MGATALVSGGKDSIYSAYLSESQGRPIDELLTIRPVDPESLMFHTPNLHLVELQARAWGKRHREVRVEATGEAAERTALRDALAGSREWVVAGAIASSFQWSRLHSVCFELGRPLFTPLWGKDASRVVREEIAAGLDIRLVHLAAEPLTADLLGRRLDSALLEEIERLGRVVRPVHVAGEGGEYETLVVDAPFLGARIDLARPELRSSGGAHSLVVTEGRLVAKSLPEVRKPS